MYHYSYGKFGTFLRHPVYRPARPADAGPGGINNKSAQRNFGRGPRCGAVAYVRRKVLIGYNAAPQIRPQKYSFPWTDPQTPLLATFTEKKL